MTYKALSSGEDGRAYFLKPFGSMTQLIVLSDLF